MGATSRQRARAPQPQSPAIRRPPPRRPDPPRRARTGNGFDRAHRHLPALFPGMDLTAEPTTVLSHMSLLDSVFKAYDIRGIVPDQIDSDLARAVGSAFARFAGAPRVLVGRDMRPSGVD
ncbi:MAG: hypothetical protein ACYC1D_10890, partial [Acidimicrobiales bacterium]